MEVANTLAYYNTATTSAVKSFFSAGPKFFTHIVMKLVPPKAESKLELLFNNQPL